MLRRVWGAACTPSTAAKPWSPSPAHHPRACSGAWLACCHSLSPASSSAPALAAARSRARASRSISGSSSSRTASVSTWRRTASHAWAASAGPGEREGQGRAGQGQGSARQARAAVCLAQQQRRNAFAFLPTPGHPASHHPKPSPHIMPRTRQASRQIALRQRRHHAVAALLLAAVRVLALIKAQPHLDLGGGREDRCRGGARVGGRRFVLVGVARRARALVRASPRITAHKQPTSPPGCSAT